MAGVMGECVATAGAASTYEVVRDALVGPVGGQEFRNEDRVGAAGWHEQKVPLLAVYRPASAALGNGNRTDDHIDGSDDLFDGRMPTEFLLRENKVVTDDDLEDPTLAGDDSDAVDVVLELVEDCLNHAHGTVGIASGCAVFD